jgi:hypothetical protein
VAINDMILEREQDEEIKMSQEESKQHSQNSKSLKPLKYGECDASIKSS